MNSVKKAIGILYRDGVIKFLKRCRDYFKWQLNEYHLFLQTYFALNRGKLLLKIGGVHAKFVSNDKKSVQGTLYRFQNEHKQLKSLLNELNSKDTFYDIGANTGIYSCFASKVCKDVVAFEPYPPNILELEKNANLNSSNISIFEVALSDQTDTVGFKTEEQISSNYPGPNSPGFGKGAIAVDDDYDLEVPSIKGDDLIEDNEISEPNIVKIDVEGAEPLVIEGLQKALSKDSCRIVYCEVHRPKSSRGSIQEFNVDESDMINMFENLGFNNTTKFDNEGTEFVILARRSSGMD